MKIRNCLFAGS